MAGDHLLDRFPQVVPQVPAICHLHRVGRSRAGALCVGASSVSADDLDPAVLLQPVAKGLGLPRGLNNLWDKGGLQYAWPFR